MFKKYLLWSLVLGVFAFSCEDDRDLITVKLRDVTAAAIVSVTAAGPTECQLIMPLDVAPWPSNAPMAVGRSCLL